MFQKRPIWGSWALNDEKKPVQYNDLEEEFSIEKEQHGQSCWVRSELGGVEEPVGWLAEGKERREEQKRLDRTEEGLVHGDLRLFKGIGSGVEYNSQLLEMFKESRTGSNTHYNKVTLGSVWNIDCKQRKPVKKPVHECRWVVMILRVVALEMERKGCDGMYCGWRVAEMDVVGVGKKVVRSLGSFMEEIIMQFEECVSS